MLEKSDRGNWMQWRREYVDKAELFSYQYTPLFLCFPVLISNLLAIILHSYSLVYSEPCQTSKMEPFARIVMRKNSFYWKPIIFWWFQEMGECKGNDLFAQNHFILEVLSNSLVHTFWSKSDETSISTPICLIL